MRTNLELINQILTTIESISEEEHRTCPVITETMLGDPGGKNTSKEIYMRKMNLNRYYLQKMVDGIPGIPKLSRKKKKNAWVYQIIKVMP